MFQCFMHGYYVALDIQLFVLSHVVVLIALWRPKWAPTSAFILGFASVAAEFFVTYFYNAGFSIPGDRKYVSATYLWLYCHCLT